MPEIVMPRLSDSMEEGTIVQWLKQVGDQVAVGEELVEIETDKANMAYESDAAGILAEILAEEGETLPIGAPIARIGDSDRAQGAESTDPATASTPAPQTAPPTPSEPINAAMQAAPPESRAADGERLRASPLARRIASEGGIDLQRLSGSGPGGRIVKADVDRAASAADGGDTKEVGDGQPPSNAPTPAPRAAIETAKGEVRIEEPTKLQATVSRRMAESKATAPHFYLEAEIDMSRAVEARGKVKEIAAADLIVPSFNDMVVKAAALALREFPRANGAYRDGRFELYSRVNVGIAVAARDALVVPTLFDADRKGLWQIGTEARELSRRVREGQITPPELSGATFTVSNLGMFGIDAFAAVINPPQAAILAVGAIREQPAVREGEIVSAHRMRVNLACDHRILYGAQGAEFLGRIRELLEEPFSLAL